MKTIEGQISAEGLDIAIVASRFNSFIVDRLVEGALDCLRRHGAQEDRLTLVRVPGAFEIPLAAKLLADKKEIDAVVCLGAVIRGSTTHYDYVCSEVSKGIAHVSLESRKPVIFGVLTTENIEQAVERAGTKAGNKGFAAASAALEMLSLLAEIR